MDPRFEGYYQAIGQQAVDLVGQETPKILVYCEVESGASTCGLFYRDDAKVVYRHCPYELDDTIYRFWEEWREVGTSEWRCLTYLIENGQFDLSLAYPEEIDPEEFISDRRPRVIAAHFGNLPVDYSVSDELDWG